MSDEVTVNVGHESDIVTARGRVRDLAAGIGFDETEITLIATAVSELARNIVAYAGWGEIVLRAVIDGRGQGISIVARDDGPGIADTDQAMQDGFSTGGGLGLGLSGTKRLMDEFDLDSKPGHGTTVSVAKWLRG